MSIPHSTTRRRLAVVLAIAALLAAGCGGDDPAATDTATDLATDTETATETETTTEPAESMAPTESTETTAAGAGATVGLASSDLGEILVDAEGMTLYVFDNDDVDTSACTDDCLAAWPPLLAEDVTAGEGVTAELGTFTREDGDVQVTANGLPLYYYAADQAPGDVTGQAVGDVWWVVDAAGEKVTAAAADDETTAAGAGATVGLASSDLGEILVDPEGLTLYVFDNDDVDTSACTDDCLAAWPPLLAEDVTAGEGVTAELGTFTREDGDVQVTANGLPLYYYAADQAAGDVTGQAVGDVWWVVDAAGEKVTAAANGAASNDGYGAPNY